MRTGRFGRVRVLVTVGVAAGALAAIGAAVTMAVSAGTAGELNYQVKTFTIEGTKSGGSSFFTRKANCPPDRHVTGGGFEGDREFASGFDGRPFDGADAGTVPDDGWAITASIFGENTGEVTVYAICDD